MVFLLYVLKLLELLMARNGGIQLASAIKVLFLILEHIFVVAVIDMCFKLYQGLFIKFIVFCCTILHSYIVVQNLNLLNFCIHGRFKIQIEVTVCQATAMFVLFDSDMSYMIEKSCAFFIAQSKVVVNLYKYFDT
jgi:hypothetical protein